jgi:two-component system CheB/CheR fusion protein
VPLQATETPEYRVACGEAFRLEFTVDGADGSRRWFEATGRPLADEAAGVLVIRDISDRTMRRLQEEFLTWAAHELRTPMTAVQGYLQLAERKLATGVHDQAQRFLGLAIHEIQRQAALITELMDASRLQSGKLTLEQAPLDLVPLVTQTVESAEVLTPGQTIAFTPPPEPIMVAGDAARLQQVVLNLLTNAITHAPETECIDVRVQRHDGLAEIVVQDTGPGIPAEALETIFGRFAQVNPAARAGRAGLGLGLYIAREIIAAHGGTITAASTLGEGATFTVRLPLLEHAP